MADPGLNQRAVDAEVLAQQLVFSHPGVCMANGTQNDDFPHVHQRHPLGG